MKNLILIIILFLLFTGCGGGSVNSSSSENIVNKTGILIDDIVSGIKYVNNGKSGVTDTNGRFSYTGGLIEFFVGNIKIGELTELPDDGNVFIQDIVLGVDSQNINYAQVLKIAVLLQSLDSNPLTDQIEIKANDLEKFNSSDNAIYEISDIESVENLLISKGFLNIVSEGDASRHVTNVHKLYGLSNTEDVIKLELETSNIKNGDTNISIKPKIELEFTDDLQKKNIYDGSFELLDSKGNEIGLNINHSFYKVKLEPTNSLEHEEVYVFNIKPNIESFSSERLKEPIHISFITESLQNSEDIESSPEIEELPINNNDSKEKVLDVQSPVFISSSNININEKQTSVLTVKATDINTIAYALSGRDASSFNLNPNTGVLTFKVAADYETKKLYSLTIVAMDSIGNSSRQNLTININDIIESNENQYSYIPTNVDNKLAHSFLLKSSFGPTPELIEEVKSKGIVNWLDTQLNISSAYDSSTDEHLTYLERTIEIAKMVSPKKWSASIKDYIEDNNSVFVGTTFPTPVKYFYASTWFENALNGIDQLRQRVAYALSQLVVLSNSSITLNIRAEAFSYHNDILAKHAFGNYRDILLEVSKSPGMGVYLTHEGSKKFDSLTNQQPDENYARELMQLFTIGLSELNIDGSIKLDTNGNEIATYTQSDVEELSRVFTGWDVSSNDYYGDNNGSYTQEMEFTSNFHDYDKKTFLGKTISSGNTGAEDIESAIDILMENPNMAPFISKQLIMRLVTSNPIPSYIQRVSEVFNDNGNGIKGDLKAVIKAILLDEEAIVSHDRSGSFGKVKEPLLAYTQFLRAFEVDYYDPWDGNTIGADSGVSMKDVYLFRSDYLLIFGQGPMQSKSVFNFYSPSYSPNDEYFNNNNLVSPELQIQTAQRVINFSNHLRDTWHYMRLDYNGSNIHTGSTTDKYIIHFVKERELVEEMLEGNYSNIRKEPFKTNAINALFDYVNEKLTASNLSDEQVDIIKKELSLHTYETNRYGSTSIIQKAINSIATTNRYMIQN